MREAGNGSGSVVCCRAAVGRRAGGVGGRLGDRGRRLVGGVASVGAWLAGPVSPRGCAGAGGPLSSTSCLAASGGGCGRGAGGGDAAPASAVGCEADPDGVVEATAWGPIGAVDADGEPDLGPPWAGGAAEAEASAGLLSAVGTTGGDAAVADRHRGRGDAGRPGDRGAAGGEGGDRGG